MTLLLLLLAAPAAADPTCRAWLDDPGVVAMDQAPLTEISGIAEGAVNPGVLYALEDAGHDAVLHLLRLDGLSLGAQAVDGATNTDWEDLAAGPCPGGGACLWIADIGDNNNQRPTRTLWIVPESLDDRVSAEECTVSFADGEVRDAETLLVFPDGTLRLVTKEGDGDAHVYLGDTEDCADGAATLEPETTLTLGQGVTGGTVSPAGDALLLRSDTQAWLFPACPLRWDRLPEPFPLDAEAQGEALTWLADGRLVTAGEADELDVHVYACDDAGSPCEEGCGCAAGGPGDGLPMVGLLLTLGLGLGRRRA